LFSGSRRALLSQADETVISRFHTHPYPAHKRYRFELG